MTGSENLKPFKPGDERINRKGRPRKPNLITEMAQEIGYEPPDISTDKLALSKIEAILRDWFNSKNFQKQLAAVQYDSLCVPLGSGRCLTGLK